MEQPAVLNENTDITKLNKRRYGNALFRKLIHNLSGINSHSPNHSPKESISVFPLKTGSLAVEAALVLPIFLYALLCLMSVLNLMRISVHLQQVLYEEGMYLSETAYGKSGISQEDAIREMLEKTDSLQQKPDYSLSDLSDPEHIRLAVSYEGRLAFDQFRLFHKQFTQGVWIHSFTGYDHGLNNVSGDSGETYVYITEDSEVYHRNRDCSHIHLHVQTVSNKDLKKLRNQYGDRYKACSHCHAKQSDGTLYITPEGDCYHNSLDCSGLKRTVYAIPISQIGDRRPCSRCGF